MSQTSTMLLWCYVQATTPPRNEQGDIPGWVMIVVMTAGLVALIGGIASRQLGALLRDAFNSVRS